MFMPKWPVLGGVLSILTRGRYFSQMRSEMRLEKDEVLVESHGKIPWNTDVYGMAGVTNNGHGNTVLKVAVGYSTNKRGFDGNGQPQVNVIKLEKDYELSELKEIGKTKIAELREKLDIVDKIPSCRMI